MLYLKVKNNQCVDLKDIPEIRYRDFMEVNIDMMKGRADRHCVNYFGVESDNNIFIYSCIADDTTGEILLSSTIVSSGEPVPSMTCQNHNFEKFEREIHENFGIEFQDHPWLKPFRYSHERFDKGQKISEYPFFESDSEELHEVGVGPIHAGVIEPGHFRFLCNGEQILHLEIQLGYQHRGVEQLFLRKQKLLERATLAESIAGDTVAGHGTCFANIWESLCGFESDESLQFSRTLALELERIAIHTGDLAAICADIAYQLGNAVYGRLRTPIVNFFQEWGGNRLAKGLIRPGKINYPFSVALGERLAEVFEHYERDFNEMSDECFSLPSVLSRLERTGAVSYNKVLEIGAVGMSAKMSGLKRDIRASHPHDLYGKAFEHTPVLMKSGDVFSRVMLRRREIEQSIDYCKTLINKIPSFYPVENVDLKPSREKFVISITEGWRGEICHCAITGKEGELRAYKIKDPSHHNWMVLAQAVKNNEISDFPVCNKSFNLSYCGHDL